MHAEQNILLLAIGNDGREDDGLGWAFGQAIEEWGFPGEVEYRFQLQVEDADLLRSYKTVIFVDASRESLPGGFRWSALSPSEEFHFSTHAIAPGTVLSVCRELYGAAPSAFLLALEGASWELRTGLSGTGSRHLENALEWFRHEFAHS